MKSKNIPQNVRSELASIVESSDDAIISKSLDGIITSWNRGAERLYGYTSEEAVGQHISLIAPPDLPDEIPNIMEKLRRGERIVVAGDSPCRWSVTGQQAIADCLNCFSF